MSTNEPSGLGPEKIRQVPALITFKNDIGISKGGALSQSKTFEILFYQGEGKSSKIVVKDPPQQLGAPLLAAMLASKRWIDTLDPPDEFTHHCPGVLDGGVKCLSTTFEVTINRKIDKVFVLRLDCPKCGTTILQDIRSLTSPAMGTVGEIEIRPPE